MNKLLAFIKNNTAFSMYFLVFLIIVIGIIINLKDFFSQPVLVIIGMFGILVGSFYFMFSMYLNQKQNQDGTNN